MQKCAVPSATLHWNLANGKNLNCADVGAACAFAEVGRRRRTRGAPAPDVQRELVARGRDVPRPPLAASPPWGSPRRRGGGGCPYRASSLRRPSIADLEPRAATMRLCPRMGLQWDWSFASVANRRKQESRGSNGCPKRFFRNARVLSRQCSGPLVCSQYVFLLITIDVN